MYELIPIIQLSIFLLATIVVSTLLFTNYWEQSKIMSSYAKAMCLVALVWQPIAIARFIYTMHTPTGAILTFVESIFFHSHMCLIVLIQIQLLKAFSGMSTWLTKNRLDRLQIFTIICTIIMWGRNAFEFVVLRYRKPDDLISTIPLLVILTFTMICAMYEGFHFVYLTQKLSELIVLRRNTTTDLRNTQLKQIWQLKYLSLFNMLTTFFSILLYTFPIERGPSRC
jgi:hypothetical protein